MSQYVNIYIDGQLCDLPNDLISLKLTYALRDRSGIAVNSGSRSEYSFELPATKWNDIIFQGFWDVGRINQDAQLFRRSSIEVDGLPYFQGKSQLTSVSTQNNQFYWQGLKYKVAFYGSNIDWVADVREKRLYEYPYSTHTFNDATIALGWQNTYALADYGYTLIKWKDWNYPNKVQYQESTPFLFIASIVDYIFDDLGYTVNSNFLSTDFFQRLIMPIPLPEKFDGGFSDDYLTIAAEETGRLLSSFPIAAVLVYTNQTVSPAIGGNPYNVANGQYTAPYDGFYLFEYRAELSSFTGSAGLTLALQQNTVNIPQSQVGIGTLTSNSTIKGEWVIEAAAGDIIEVVLVRNTTAGDCNVDFYLDVKGEIPVKAGAPIDFKYLINKEWKALDFLKGLAHAFNLVFQSDPITQEVTIEPSDQYQYLQRSPTSSSLENGFYTNDFIDLTPLVDLEKQGEVKSATNEGDYIGLSWKYEGQTEQAINEAQDLKLLEGRYAMPVDRFSKEGKTIENPFFAATLQMMDNSIKSDDSLLTPQIPLIWNGNYFENNSSSEANYNIMPRILYKAPYLAIQGYNAEVRLDNGVGGFNDVLCPLSYMVHYTSNLNSYISLSFGNEIINGAEVKGLIDRFYLAEMKRKEIGKSLELYAYWKLLDIMNLDFSKKRTINNDPYILQEINSFDVLNDASTKTYLLYDAFVEDIDSDNVVSADVDNKVVE